MKLIVKDDIDIDIDGTVYRYFMTNNYTVLGEKLKEYDCRNVYMNDLHENNALSVRVREKMEALGACYSLTVSHGAKVLNYYVQGKPPMIARLENLKPTMPKRAKHLTEEYRKKMWSEISKAFSSVYDNPSFDMNVIKDWDLAFFCSRLVHGKSAEYYLYLLMNCYGLSNVQKKMSFQQFLDVLIYHHVARGQKISDIYKNSGMNKETFSRIRSGKIVRPEFKSVLQLVLGLKLPWLYALILIDTAGYTSEIRTSVGITVFESIVHGNYSIDDINEKLWSECKETIGFTVRGEEMSGKSTTKTEEKRDKIRL